MEGGTGASRTFSCNLRIFSIVLISFLPYDEAPELVREEHVDVEGERHGQKTEEHSKSVHCAALQKTPVRIEPPRGGSVLPEHDHSATAYQTRVVHVVAVVEDAREEDDVRELD